MQEVGPLQPVSAPQTNMQCGEQLQDQSKEMASFFLQCDYPLAVLDRALQHVDTIP